MTPTIREATPDDAESIGQIHVRSWQSAYRGIMPAEFLDGLDVAERIEEWGRILRGEVPVGTLPFPINVVAEVDNQAVGFANIGVFRQPEDDSPTPRAQAAAPGELWAMYVDPDAWGTGAGYALMRVTMAEFQSKTYDKAYLWVLTENDRARRFYERQGWASDGVTTDIEMRGVTVNEIRYSIDVESAGATA